MEGTKIGFKACPFCGGEPEIKVRRFGMEKFDRYAAVCEKCGICLGFHRTVEQAANKWNRRAEA